MTTSDAGTQRLTSTRDLVGLTAVDREGERIGKIQNMYLDEQTGRPEWVAVSTGWFGTKVSFVPLSGARVDGDDAYVNYTKEQVKNAPRADADEMLSNDEEARLYRHYGRTQDTAPYPQDSGEALPGDAAARDALPRDAMPREAGLADSVTRDAAGLDDDDQTFPSAVAASVDPRPLDYGRARLRKYVVTEYEYPVAADPRDERRDGDGT